jgi:hypothetical protein
MQRWGTSNAVAQTAESHHYRETNHIFQFLHITFIFSILLLWDETVHQHFEVRLCPPVRRLISSWTHWPLKIRILHSLKLLGSNYPLTQHHFTLSLTHTHTHKSSATMLWKPQQYVPQNYGKQAEFLQIPYHSKFWSTRLETSMLTVIHNV